MRTKLILMILQVVLVLEVLELHRLRNNEKSLQKDFSTGGHLDLDHFSCVCSDRRAIDMG